MTTIVTYQAVPPLPLHWDLAPCQKPLEYLLEVLDYIAALEERPAPDYVREVAALEETLTYVEDEQQERYDEHCARLLSGEPRVSATTDELRCDALALFGLARDRAANGEWALPAKAWLQLAEQTVSVYELPCVA